MDKSWVAGLVFLLIIIAALAPGIATTEVDEAPEIETYGNFSVRIFISTTLSMNDSATGFNWTLIYPGLINETANNFLNITIDPITNIATDVYLKATNLTSGGNTISVPPNLVVDDSLYLNSRPYQLQNSYPSGPDAGYFEDIPKPAGAARERDLYMFLTVPNGTLAGDYSGNLTLKIVGTGVAP